MLRSGAVRALACPASLKGVLAAGDAAEALAEGLLAWADDVARLPVADGGEGTLDVLHSAGGGTWRRADVHDAYGRPRRARWVARNDGTAVVEAAEAIPLDPGRLEPLHASSRGLGELLVATGRPRRLLVGLGGTATVDGGVGLREVLDALPAPTIVACDAMVPLLDAARLFAAQKGASAAEIGELAARLVELDELRPVADFPGAGAGGGLGAALAALGAELASGARLVLAEIGFDPRGFDLVLTGEGTVDRTSARGKAPGEVARQCAEAGIPCVVFGGRVEETLPSAETVALSGDPGRARADLVALGAAARRYLRSGGGS